MDDFENERGRTSRPENAPVYQLRKRFDHEGCPASYKNSINVEYYVLRKLHGTRNKMYNNRWCWFFVRIFMNHWEPIDIYSPSPTAIRYLYEDMAHENLHQYIMSRGAKCTKSVFRGSVESQSYFHWTVVGSVARAKWKQNVHSHIFCREWRTCPFWWALLSVLDSVCQLSL